MKRLLVVIMLLGLVAVSSAQERNVKSIMEKAKAGDPASQYNVGIMYETGDGLKQDLDQARTWYEKAESQGQAGAAYRLGLMYEFGQGVAPDGQKAMDLYQKAAEGGDVEAQMKLAAHFGDDRQQAFYWMKKAAEAGNPVAQYNTATSYQVGDGVEKNYDQAIFWYQKAAENGMSQAGPALKELQDTLAKRKVPQP